MMKPLPPVNTLRQLLRYEPESGLLYWLPRTVEWFNATDGRSAEHASANWNARYAGKEAFTTVNRHGYRFGAILDVHYFAHRVIWALCFGEDPPAGIDHINGDPADNRLENLRLATQGENMRNLKRPRNNTSGVAGVYWKAADRKWVARIRVDGRYVELGRFLSLDEAAAARKAAEQRCGYHENHGRG